MNLKSKGLQFAVVREDPLPELELIRRFGIRKPIFIASGGCTALSLSAAFPELPLTLIEPNPSQIAHIKKKMRVLAAGRHPEIERQFSIGHENTNADSLIEAGNFESLFRQFRRFLFEFVMAEEDFARLLRVGNGSDWRKVFRHPYWPVAFEVFFADPLLRTMFGPAAIQHAPPGSYPRHFRAVLEGGLLRRDRPANYFLHHIFLGYYLKDRKAQPLYLTKKPTCSNVAFLHSLAEEVPSFAAFDLVGLSNIFDWSSAAQVRFLARKLARELQAGSVVLYRQLNNQKNFRALFGPHFRWETRLAAQLHARDRSLFYSALHIGVKR